MASHSHDLGNDLLTSPLDAKHLSQLLQVVCGSLTDREDSISQPAHAQVAEFLIKELDPKLACK